MVRDRNSGDGEKRGGKVLEPENTERERKGGGVRKREGPEGSVGEGRRRGAVWRGAGARV